MKRLAELNLFLEAILMGVDDQDCSLMQTFPLNYVVISVSFFLFNPQASAQPVFSLYYIRDTGCINPRISLSRSITLCFSAGRNNRKTDPSLRICILSLTIISYPRRTATKRENPRLGLVCKNNMVSHDPRLSGIQWTEKSVIDKCAMLRLTMVHAFVATCLQVDLSASSLGCVYFRDEKNRQKITA